MSSIINTLKDLKIKLSSTITSDIEALKKEKEEKNKVILNEKLKKFKENQANKLNICVGGLMYSINKYCLINCNLKSIFSNVSDSQKELFYDGSPFLFKYIILLIKNFNNVDNNYVSTIVINKEDDSIVLNEMIKEVFLHSKDNDIFKRIKVEKKSAISNVVEPVNNAEINNNNNNNNNNNYNNYNYDYNDYDYNYNEY